MGIWVTFQDLAERYFQTSTTGITGGQRTQGKDEQKNFILRTEN
jgi:hypothetical protein